MSRFLKLLKIEIRKLKSQYFFLFWFLITAAAIAWLLHPGTHVSTDRIIMESPVIYQEYDISSAIMILSLFLPLLAGLLISKLIDMEHKGDTFKLLKENSKNLAEILIIKFFIVYLLLELSTILTIVSSVLDTYFKTGITVPLKETVMTILNMSLVSFIVLVILGYFSLEFKNQFVVLIITLFIGMINLMSSLFPVQIVKLLPFSYYTLCILTSSVLAGKTQEGLSIWEIIKIKPDYGLIFLVTIPFLIFFILMLIKLERKEF